MMGDVGGGFRFTCTFRVPAFSAALDTDNANWATGVPAALTTMSKLSETVPPLPSLAVTFTVRVPTSPDAGVPLKVRVAGAKVNQVGRALPSPFVAV